MFMFLEAFIFIAALYTLAYLLVEWVNEGERKYLAQWEIDEQAARRRISPVMRYMELGCPNGRDAQGFQQWLSEQGVRRK